MFPWLFSGREEVLPAGKTAWENAGRHLQIYQAVRRAGTTGSWGASEDLTGRDHLAANSPEVFSKRFSFSLQF